MREYHGGNAKLAGLAILTVMGAVRWAPAADLYVSPAGSHTPPYENWVKAAHDIQAALDIAGAGDVVYVTNVVFSLATPVMVTNGVRLIGSNNAAGARAMLDGAGVTRCITIQHADAVVDGFVISNGYSTATHGGGVRIEQGTLRHCLVFSNRVYSASAARHGGGAYVINGLVENCVFTFNRGGTYTYSYGGGLYVNPGVISNCEVTENVAWGGGGICLNGADSVIDGTLIHSNGWPAGVLLAGGLRMSAGIFRNSTCSWNRSSIYSASEYGGAGIYLTGGIVSNCLIADNQIYRSHPDEHTGGGGVWMAGGQLLNSRIVGNLAGVYSGVDDSRGNGGGVLIRGGLMADCLVASNAARRSSASLGGKGMGVAIIGANSVVRDCEIRDNYYYGNETYGGGVYNNGGLLLRCQMVRNSILFWGGGVFLTGGGTVQDCVVASNRATGNAVDATYYFGGGLFVDNGTVLNTRVEYNRASRGGGAHLRGTNALLRNVLVAGNETFAGADRNGGGVHLRHGFVENCTVVGNAAAAAGGGIYRETANVTNGVTNSIFYHNSAATSTNVANGDAAVCGYCCAADGLAVGVNGNITADPVFMDAGSGAGTNAVLGDYHLTVYSPAMHAGLYQDWMDAAVDLDGNRRVDRLIRRVDMGCYERLPPGGVVRIR